MVNRLFAVMYIITGVWALFGIVALNGFGPGFPAFLMLGVGPILGVAVVHYILFGRL